MKLFTLISGQDVRIAPGQKRIPALEFSTIQDAAEILEKVEEETKEFKQKTELEAEEEKKRGHEEGFQEGLESFNKHLFALDEELKELRIEIQKKLLPLTLSAARKILGEELKLHPERIVDIVLNSLKPVTQHKKIIIYANKSDLEMLEKEKPRIKEIFEHLQSFSIQERDDIEPGGCMIETEAGIINAQLENQWRALESAFSSFMGKPS
ncbi:MAG TPA: HrpE/YscL family type III secretion apparatus protein [Chlamydiales bacterium]|nr:HrpE/YscL family type III secretion apparatus protein [Chlamydiales bacterium]